MELKKLRGVILAGLALIGLALSIFLAKNLIDNKASAVAPARKIIKEVVVQKALNGPVTISVPAQGLVTAKKRIEIYSEVQGVFRMGAQLFRTGQSYQSNEILLQIDAAEYLANVKSSRTNLYNQIAAILPDIRLDISKEYLTWRAFLNAIDINKNLPELPQMSDDNLKLFVSGRGVLGAYYAVKNLEQRLSKYQVRAPFNGVLTEALVTEGTLVRAGQKLGEYIDPSVYEMEVNINETSANLLKKGTKVTIYNLNKTNSWEAIVVRVNGKIDQATQTVKTYLQVKGNQLREGMYLTADLESKSIEDAIEVSRKLLVDDTKLFTVKDSTLNLVSVNPVYFNDNTVIIQGLENGTTILSKPLPGAYHGMLVKTINETINN